MILYKKVAGTIFLKKHTNNQSHYVGCNFCYITRSLVDVNDFKTKEIFEAK